MSNIPSSPSADYASLGARLRAAAEARAAQNPAVSAPQPTVPKAPIAPVASSAPIAPPLARADRMVSFSSKGLELAQQGPEAPARSQRVKPPAASSAPSGGAGALPRGPIGDADLAEARFSPKALELARAAQQQSAGSAAQAAPAPIKASSGLAASFEAFRLALKPADAAAWGGSESARAEPAARAPATMSTVAGPGGAGAAQSGSVLAAAGGYEGGRLEEQARPRGLAGAYHDGSGGSAAAPAKKGGLFDSLG